MSHEAVGAGSCELARAFARSREIVGGLPANCSATHPSSFVAVFAPLGPLSVPPLPDPKMGKKWTFQAALKNQKKRFDVRWEVRSLPLSVFRLICLGNHEYLARWIVTSLDWSINVVCSVDTAGPSGES